MPVIKTVRKALRGSKRKKVMNTKRKDAMKAVVKDVKKLAADKKADEARKKLAEAYQAIDKAAKRGVIKKNAAARKKSRLVAMIKKAA